MKESTSIIELPVQKMTESTEILTKYITKVDNISLFFNGGKDSIVLLHIFKTVLEDYALVNNIDPIPIIYIKLPDDFPELQNYVINVVNEFPNHLKYVQIIANSIKDGVIEYAKLYPDRKYVLLGFRKDDPNTESVKDSTQKTTSTWPELNRIYPLFNWTYDEIWNYILHYKIKYCKLYDMGYSSIGEKGKSKVNPYLFVDGKPTPAYKLIDPKLERLGRY